MTLDQFDVCARKQSGNAVKAAGLVLVFGYRPCDAARELATPLQSVNNAVSRIRKRHDEIVRAYVA